MGQQNSQLQNFIPPNLANLLSEELSTLICSEIHTLTYEQFHSILSELNKLSKNCLDIDGKQYVFAIKKGTDTTLFWKATIQIACVRILPITGKIDTYRLLSLNEFLKVFQTLKCQNSAVEQSKSTESIQSQENSDVPKNVSNSDKSADAMVSLKECCICLERQHEVMLPCSHSFCMQCVEEWNETNNTCPICREKLESIDDTWVLSEVPNAEEINKEIQSNLSELIKNKSDECLPS